MVISDRLIFNVYIYSEDYENISRYIRMDIILNTHMTVVSKKDLNISEVSLRPLQFLEDT